VARPKYYVQHSYFLENVGVLFHTIKTEALTPRICFFEEKMGKRFKKSNSGVNIPGLNFVKKDPTFSKIKPCCT
jgi:hypothetical protein